MIVPVGSKGGFVPRKQLADRAAAAAEAKLQYQAYMSGLLDITDNYVGTKIVSPPGVVRYALESAGRQRKERAIRSASGVIARCRPANEGNQQSTVKYAAISPTAENSAICRRPGNGTAAITP